VIARSHNLTELLNDVTAHAEMQAITAAANSWRKYLVGCTLYVSLEPCQMLLEPCIESNFKNCFRANDEHRGCKMGTQITSKTVVKRGVLAEEASDLMKRFFAKGMIFNDMPQYWYCLNLSTRFH
jgi:tRNA(adenine34) deaminase